MKKPTSAPGDIDTWPTKYSFALNPYPEYRFSKCPWCNRLMNLRKFALLMYVEETELFLLGKTCRYCPRCELIIAHQDELENVMAGWFSTRDPKVVGNPYLAIGSFDMKGWHDDLEGRHLLGDLAGKVSRFKQYASLSVEGRGWAPSKKPSREHPPTGKPREADRDEIEKQIHFTLSDRKLILGLLAADLELENRFKLAVATGGGIVVNMNAYDLDDLLNAIASDANHAESRGRRRILDGLFERVDRKLQSEFPLE